MAETQPKYDTIQPPYNLIWPQTEYGWDTVQINTVNDTLTIISLYTTNTAVCYNYAKNYKNGLLRRAQYVKFIQYEPIWNHLHYVLKVS